MLVKTIIVFLAAIALLGMIGKWLFPGAISRSIERRVKPLKCPGCGRYLMGRGTCECGRKG
jgi:hypothetical protein